jgi:hypothetical protein
LKLSLFKKQKELYMNPSGMYKYNLVVDYYLFQNYLKDKNLSELVKEVSSCLKREARLVREENLKEELNQKAAKIESISSIEDFNKQAGELMDWGQDHKIFFRHFGPIS